MRFFTYDSSGKRRVGVMPQRTTTATEEVFVPLSVGSMLELIAQESAGLEAARQRLESGPHLSLSGARILAPIPDPVRNVLCLGWNYAAHSREAAASRGALASKHQKLPERPIFFTKATTTVIGMSERIPAHTGITSKLDWEVELGVVIGRRGVNIPRERALEHVFGYTVINDVSAREVQTGHGGQFFKGKSLDGTCPMGPWIVTASDIPDPHRLRLTCHVNGERKQDGNTSELVFDIPAIIEWLSRGMTILPGDIIATGTPAGVGFARDPPEFLEPGDVVECEIEGIGVLRNAVEEEDVP